MKKVWVSLLMVIMSVTFAAAEDVTAPGKITGLLSYQHSISSSVFLTWTTPGDDAYLVALDIGSCYRIQYSTFLAAAWSTSTAQVEFSTSAVAPGSLASCVVTGLTGGVKHWFSIWAGDDAGNWSALSAAATGFVSPFTLETLDITSEDSGGASDIAVDNNGDLHVCYYSYTGSNYYLKYKKYSSGSWTTQTVDSGYMLGNNCSITIDHNNNPWIAYQGYDGSLNINRGTLKVARYTGSSWQTTVVDDPGVAIYLAGFTAITTDGFGTVHVAYFNSSNNTAKYAKWDGVQWSTSTINNNLSVCSLSIAVDQYSRPYIGYGYGGFAKWTGVVWSTYTASNGQASNSIILDSSGNVHMANYSTYLRYVKFVGTFTVTDSIIDNSAVGTGQLSAITLDGNGNPNISYYDGSSAYDLKYIRWDGVCWSTYTIDSYGSKGLASKIAVDKNGDVHIVYRDLTNSHLKYAKWASAGFAKPMGGNAAGRLQAPTNFTASSYGTNSIAWQWTDNATNETGFRLLYSTETNTVSMAADENTIGANVTSYSQAGLTPNTSYFGYVAAVNNNTIVMSSGTKIVTLPNAPASLTKTDSTSYSIGLSWNANSNPYWTAYEIVCSTDNFAVSTTTVKSFSDNFVATAYTHSGLLDSTTYWYKVRAFNIAQAASVYTSVISGLTSPNIVPPADVTDLASQPGSVEGQVRLAWTAPGDDGTTGNITGGSFKIYSTTYTAAATWGNIAQSSNTVQGQIQELTLTGLDAGVTYYLKLQTADIKSNWSGMSNIATTYAQVDVTAPGQVTGLAAYQYTTAGSIFVSWTTPGDNGYSSTMTNGSGYKIQYSTALSNDWSVANAQITISTSSVAPGVQVSTQVFGLIVSKTYFVRTWAFDENNNFSAISATCTVFSSPFSISYIDPQIFAQKMSAAVDADGNIHVSYREYGVPSGGRLKYAKWNGTVWSTSTVDSDSNAGNEYNNIAVDGNNVPHIAYRAYAGSYYYLKYAKLEGSNWVTETVDSSAGINRGYYASIAVDAQNMPHIAYQDNTANDLKYAKKSATGWAVQTVGFSTNTTGMHTAIALDSYGNPFIMYGSNDSPYYLWCSSWSPTTGWRHFSGPSYAYQYISVALDGRAYPQAAFSWNSQLGYSKWNGSSWGSSTIEALNPGFTGYGTSIALDGNGNPAVSYCEYTGEDLKFAKYNGVSWSTYTVATQGRILYYSSVAIDKNGDAVIVYNDGSYTWSVGKLAVAKWTGAGYSPSVGGASAGRAQAPKQLYSTGVSTGSIAWAWTDNASNETGYRLYTSSPNASFSIAASSDIIGADVTSYTQTSLLPNTSYYNYIAAVSNGGVVVSSVTRVFTLARVPTGLTVDSSGSSAIQISWSANSNPAYTVYGIVKSTDNFVTVSTTVKSYSDGYTNTMLGDSGLSTGTSYWYKVVGYNGDGVAGEYSAVVTTMTDFGDIYAPAAVTDLFAAQGSVEGSLALTWTAPGDNGALNNLIGGQFKVQYSTFSSVVWSTAAVQIVISTTAVPGVGHTTVITGLSAGTTHYAYLWSVDAMNNISVISNGTTSWAQVDVTAPGQVTGLQSSIVGIPNSAYLSWVTPGDNVYTSTFVAGSGYKIQYSTVSVTSWVSENAQVVVSTSGIAPGQRVYILVTGLVAETTNWFRIWAYDELGNYSVVSDSITFTPSPFSYEILDSDGYTGAYPVVAVDSNGYPHIAYSAGNPLKVKYTKWTGSVWVSTNVDITSENGDDTYVSLALDGNDLPHITFTKNSNLFYANFNGVNWSTSVVTTYANFSSIIVDPAGYPNIAYADSLVSNLKFARWSGTAWSTSTVDSVGTTTRGQYCNLAIDDTGKAYISYLVTNPEYNLMVARYNNSVWTTETVYGAETEINYASSLAMDGERNLHVSLRQETGKDLYYAKYSNSAWVVNPVYTNGDVGKYNAISLDGNANPVIAYSEYVDATDENLMYSRWNGTNWINGCIDAQTRAGTVYPMSVATNNSGTVYIAYFDATSSDLKLAVWSNSGLASPVAGTPRSKAQMPKLVGTSAVYSSSITWSWVDNASNETGYRLYASTTAGASYQLEANESTLVPNTQSYTQVLLSPNNPYSVYVAVVNTGGVAYTAVVTTYTLSLPPTDISAVALSSHSVCVTWSANGNSGTTRWGIERSTDNFVASNTTVKSYNDNFTSTSFTDSGLVNGTQYYYRVKSFNSTGAAAGNNSPVSATPSNGLNTAPNAVTDLTAVPGDTAAQLKLTWTATGENGTAGDLSNAQYKIQYATYTPVWDMNNAQVVITSNIVAGAWQSKVVAGLTENVVYYVTLWIGDEIGNWSGISNVSSSTAKTTLPATPTDMNGTAISGTSILWSWTDNSATENGYIVRTSTSGIVAELGSNTTYWTETGLSPNKAYTRDSYVYNYGGGIAGTPAVMYTLANPPVNTGFSDVQNTSITVTWSINSNPTGTRWGISRSTNGFVDSTVLASYATNLTSTTYNDTGLDTGTRYYYKVLAYNDAAGHLESSYDTAVSVVAEYDVMPPAALTEIVAIPGADVGILDLSWITPGDNGMSGILEPGAQLAVQYSSYTVNWATAAAQVVVSTSSVSPGTQVFHRFSTLTAGATYYVKVWYSDERGNWSDISESATCYAQARDTVLPGTPSGFTASSGILVRLQWLAGGDNSSTGDVVNGKWRIRMSSTVGATYDTAEYSVAVTTSYAAGSTQSVNVTGIAYNVTYYYWLSGQDETDGNWSPWVTATYFLNDTTPPTAPGTPADTGVYTIDNTQVVFVWTGSADTETGLTKYLICVGTFSGGTSVYNNYDVGNNTWTLLSGLTLQSGTVYYAKVCAMNNAGLFSSYSGNSDGIMVDTTTPVINGSVNDGISTDVDIQLSSGTLCINWTAASEPESGIKEYLVAISTAEGENSVNNVLEWSSVGVQLSTAVVSSALEYGRTYYTKIKVVNNAGLSIAVVSDGVVLDNTTVPPAPVAFKGIVLSSDCVKWSWESGTTYISGFYIKSSTGGIVAVLPASTSEYVETGLLDNQQSARYVEAYNVVGSSAVPVVSVFTYVNTPSSVTVVSTAQHVLGLAWPAGRATAFKVGISSDNAVWAIVADKVECTTSVVTGLLPGTTYTVALWYYNADYVLSIDSAVVANVVTIPLEQTVMVPTVAATETKTFTVNGSQLEIRVEVPQGTVDKPVYVAINQNAELAPTNPEVKQKIADAIQKLDVILTDKQIVSNVVELNMYDLAGSKVSGNFAQTVTLSIPYLDVNNDGFVDNTTPLLKEKSLKVYLLNEANSAWELVGGDVDETLNIVHVAVNHFSVYTVIGTKMPENDLAKTRVYPNPYNLGLGVNGITFDYLTAKARIMIFTVTGELVFDQTVETAGKYQWDMANTSGGTVASGVYIYRITNPDNAANVKTGKLAVVK